MTLQNSTILLNKQQSALSFYLSGKTVACKKWSTGFLGGFSDWGGVVFGFLS